MKYIKGILFFITFPAFFLFVDYVLPSNEIMRVTSAYSRITDIGFNRMFYAEEDIVTGQEDPTDTKRDVRFISTVTESGDVKIFRNEDTGWVYPPYFKYDSATLQGEFDNLKSTEENPKWVRVTSYGWRIPWLSIFPNAVSVTRVEGPQVDTVSLSALFFLTLMYFFVLFLHRSYLRLMRRSVNPMLKDLDDRTDALRDDVMRRADQKTKGFRDWLGTWRGVARK